MFSVAEPSGDRLAADLLALGVDETDLGDTDAVVDSKVLRRQVGSLKGVMVPDVSEWTPGEG